MKVCVIYYYNYNTDICVLLFLSTNVYNAWETACILMCINNYLV